MEWLESLVLGVVQGLTEFLPISSDGHLAITRLSFDWLTGKKHSDAENLFFEVMLHLGTLAAILVYYRAVVRTGAEGLLGSERVPPEYRRRSVIRLGMLAVVATLPLVPVALFLKDFIAKLHGIPTAAGIGFLITAAVLGLTAWLPGGGRGPTQTRWVDALAIGITQMFAPLPGVSRSGLTVAAALAMGLSRSWAVGFSLLIAVPAILGAAVFEVRGLDPALLTNDRVARTVSATVIAGLVGYGAIIWLVKIVRAGRLWYFSVYLVALGTIVLAAARFSGGARDADTRDATALDRPLRVGAAGSRLEGRDDRARRALDRPFATRAGPGATDPGDAAQGRRRARAEDLVLDRPLASGP